MIFLRWDLFCFFKLALFRHWAYVIQGNLIFLNVFLLQIITIFSELVTGGQLRHRYLLHRFAPNVLCPNAFCEHSSSGSEKCLEEVFAGSLCTLCRHLANLQKKRNKSQSKKFIHNEVFALWFFEMRLVLFF